MRTPLRRVLPVLALAALALAALPAAASAGTSAASRTRAAARAATRTTRDVSPRLGPAVGGRLYHVAATSPDNVWAVGLAGSRPLILHYNGAQWTEDLPPRGATYLIGVSAVARNDAWAVGGSNWWTPSATVAYRFDGTAWTRVPTPTPDGDAYFSAVVATSARNAWAVGLSGRGGPGVSGGLDVPIIEHWNGSTWEQQFFPLPKHSGWFSAIAAAGPGDAWAVGGTGSSAPNSALIEHWNGYRWRRVNTPPGLGDLQGVTVVSRNDAWAVGQSEANPNEVTSLTVHWNGRRWYVVPSPNPTGNTDLLDVSGTGPDDVWAVGLLNSNGCSPQCETAAFHWNGTSWSVVPSPNPTADYLNAFLGVVAISRRDAWAVGSTDYASTLIAHWNGTRWQ